MIQPRILKGFRDFLPEQMIPKKKIIRLLETVFENYGFSPIDTPALEYTEILLGKGSGETDKQIYRFTDHGKRDVSLRFDLTVPLARYVSQHSNELVFPFKRYHIAPVWRGENTQKGRYREFYQCDFDILGSDSIFADYEILLVIKKGFEAIGCKDFTIHVNNRAILNGVLEHFNISTNYEDFLRIIDKIYKTDYEQIVSELSELVEDRSVVEEILTLLGVDKENTSGITGSRIFDVLNNVKTVLSDEYAVKVDDLMRIFTFMKDSQILDNYAFNPVITRGLDYYTGIVFETFINDRKEFGSVCSGGRYDNLTGLYSKNSVTGVGGSFGLDRLLSLLEDKGMLESKKSTSDVMIFNMDGENSEVYFSLAEKLADNNVRSEIIYEQKKIAAQFKFTEKKGITYAIITSKKELGQNKLNLKNIETGQEYKEINIEKACSIIRDNE